MLKERTLDVECFDFLKWLDEDEDDGGDYGKPLCDYPELQSPTLTGVLSRLDRAKAIEFANTLCPFGDSWGEALTKLPLRTRSSYRTLVARAHMFRELISLDHDLNDHPTFDQAAVLRDLRALSERSRLRLSILLGIDTALTEFPPPKRRSGEDVRAWRRLLCPLVRITSVGRIALDESSDGPQKTMNKRGRKPKTGNDRKDQMIQEIIDGGKVNRHGRNQWKDLAERYREELHLSPDALRHRVTRILARKKADKK